MLSRQQEVGEYDFPWMKEYGTTWRIGGHLGVRSFNLRLNDWETKPSYSPSSS